ncbi:MAG: peptide-binding protein [Elusimicrobia bacterium RIFOXYA2_FULL_50_26]|nr:MAG: peptide-binding protein [Elusimicrobia bacterium RIFOXYA2_FULL_50_26]
MCSIIMACLAAATAGAGDMYVSAALGDASYLNPVLASDSASGTVNDLVFNGLVKYDKDIRLTGDLAESWDVSDGGLVITFHLRKNVRWHDGKPFTAEDVRFTYERLIDPKVKTPYGSDYELVKSFAVVNPYTVRITYRQKFAPALESWGMGILPKHVFSQGDFNEHPANRKPVGTGPYRFKEWKTDEKIVLDANPDYFLGKPKIERCVFRIIPDQAVQFLELRNESIDDMSLTPDQWKAYPEFFRSYNKFRYPAFMYTYLAFNLKNPLFADKRMRKAIAFAIDKKDIIGGVLLGMGKAATGPFPAQSWAYNPDVKDYEYDTTRAKALIEECGWQLNAKDGYFYKDGKRLEFTILTNQGNKMRSLSAEIIQSQLRRAGIKVNIRIVEWSSFIHQFVNKKNFDAIILGWTVGRDPDQYSIWHSGQQDEGQYNFISYNNPAVDRLLEEGRGTFDQAKRTSIYHRLHRIIFDDVPYVFLYYPESLPVIHKRFRGPEIAPLGVGWNFHDWWVPPAEQKYRLAE